jgi:hypothetical protein
LSAEPLLGSSVPSPPSAYDAAAPRPGPTQAVELLGREQDSVLGEGEPERPLAGRIDDPLLAEGPVVVDREGDDHALVDDALVGRSIAPIAIAVVLVITGVGQKLVDIRPAQD